MNWTLFHLKARFSQILNRTRLPQTILARSRWRIMLAFHRVIPRTKAFELGLHPSLFTTPETFRALLSSLKESGNFVDLDVLLSGIPPRTSFSVTFDDGWIDTYTTAYPILKELNIPFSIFIATSLINKGEMNWTEEIAARYVRILNRAPETAKKALVKLDPKRNCAQRDIHEIIDTLKEVPEEIRTCLIQGFYNELNDENPVTGEMLSWPQIKKLREEGVIIGSHTHSHRVLKGSTREQVAEELSVSKKIIHEQLALDTRIFCYPNGRYDKENEDIFSSLGFNHGFILDDKRIHENEPPFFIPRFLVYEDIVPLLPFRFLTQHK